MAGVGGAERWSWPPRDDFIEGLVRFRRARRPSAAELLELRSGERVLIDGAGTGADLDFIPDGVEVVATDLMPAMGGTGPRTRCAGRPHR